VRKRGESSRLLPSLTDKSKLLHSLYSHDGKYIYSCADQFTETLSFADQKRAEASRGTSAHALSESSHSRRASGFHETKIFFPVLNLID
jgi:hypothetical protein